MALKSSNKIDPTFNLSSLTDIVFLLLIFFLLTSTFVAPNALNLQLPTANSAAPVEKTTVTVSINPNLQYYVNGTPYAEQELTPAIKELLGDKPEEATLIIEADKNIPLQRVVNVLSIAQSLNTTTILATDPDS